MASLFSGFDFSIFHFSPLGFSKLQRKSSTILDMLFSRFCLSAGYFSRSFSGSKLHKVVFKKSTFCINLTIFDIKVAFWAWKAICAKILPFSELLEKWLNNCPSA